MIEAEIEHSELNTVFLRKANIRAYHTVQYRAKSQEIASAPDFIRELPLCASEGPYLCHLVTEIPAVMYIFYV